jgi:hypothetical protein
MKSVLVLFAAVLASVSGCATGHLYPVQGPLAAQKPPPVYTVKMDYGDTISASLGKGEKCHGTWLDVAQGDPSARDLSAEWDLVYGNGFFNANVLGNISIARANLTCPRDKTVTLEFNSAKGVAKDNDGDVFKLTF